MMSPATDLITRRRLSIALAVATLVGPTAAPGKSRSLAPVSSDSAKFGGAFVDWGPDGRELLLQAWERWLNRPRSSVLGVDFYAQTTWDDYSKLSWVPGIWKTLNPARNVVWSMPLTVAGTPLSDVARGLHDSEFKAAAKAIADAQPRAVIRLGWEMNLLQVAWSSKGREADYIAAFRRVVGIFRRYSNEFRFDWCPGWGAQDSPADAAYPGDDVVDFIGLDVYDFKYDGSVQDRWTTYYLTGPFGLEWHRDFAARHRKPMSYPEWGVGNVGDNPYFISKMHEWFMANKDAIAYAAYFNVDGQWPTQIDNGQFPQSQKRFKALFGQ